MGGDEDTRTKTDLLLLRVRKDTKTTEIMRRNSYQRNRKESLRSEQQ